MATHLELLRKTVAAKLAYWEAINELEDAIAPNSEFSDSANDVVVDMIDTLAAGGNTDDASDVTEEHLTAVVKAAQQ